MKRHPQCSRCFFYSESVQIDMGCHSDICSFCDRLLGSFEGLLDSAFVNREDCPIFVDRARIFDKLYDTQRLSNIEYIQEKLKEYKERKQEQCKLDSSQSALMQTITKILKNT